MLKCKLCSTLEQVAVNTALTLDLVGNALLLGLPGETISRRTARARAAGSVAARRFCAVLTWTFNTFLRMIRDHCTWSLAPGPSVGAEVWHWSPDVPTPSEPASALTP